MPEKDGSDDKKSTKSVVNKKQKQLMNKEQLDLTSVAESFGGQIVGEPVELDEFAFTGTALGGIALWKILAGLAGAGGIYQGGKIINQELQRRKEDAYIDNWAKGDTKKNQAAIPGSEVGTKDNVIAKDKTIAKDKVIAKDIAISQAGVKSKRLPKPFKMRMPKVPGTPHNVGRRVNPQ